MFLQNKRGISTIIVALLLVVLTIVLVAIVWTVINNLVSKNINKASSCFGNFDKVSLNAKYTCYNTSSNQVRFSLNIGDIDIDGVLISITSPGMSKSFTIKNSLQSIAGLTNYSGGAEVQLPDKNSGITYIYTWSGSDVPNSIEIAPIIKDNQCSSSDSISPIDNCNLLY